CGTASSFRCRGRYLFGSLFRSVRSGSGAASVAPSLNAMIAANHGLPVAGIRYSLAAVEEYAPGTHGPVLLAFARPGVPSRIAVVLPGRRPETSWAMIAQPKFVVSVAVIVGFVPTSPAG